MTVQANQLQTTSVAVYNNIQLQLNALAGTNHKTLYISTPQTLTVNTIQPSNVRVEFINNGKIVTNGYTYTCNGTHNNPNRQIWDMSGGGSVVYSQMKTIHPIWFNNNLNQCLLAAPVGAEILLSDTTYEPITVNRGDIKIIGSKKPVYNATNTALINGSIIKGPLLFSYDNVHIENFGIDSGLDVCNELYDGNARDGLQVGNNGIVQGIPSIKGFYHNNIISLCRDPDCLFHSAVIENCDGANINNLTVKHGVHGFAFKCKNSTVNNVITHANGYNGVIIKNNDYAPCNNNTFTGITVFADGAEQNFGLVFDNFESTETDLCGIAIAGLSINGTTNGVHLKGGSSTPIIKNVQIIGDTYSNVTNKIIPSSGTVDNLSVFISSNMFYGDATRIGCTAPFHMYGVGEAMEAFRLRLVLQIINKTRNDYITILSRNTDGAEAVGDLSNIGKIQASGGIGLFGTTVPAAKPATISDPTGGGTIDSQARIAINSILDLLQLYGLMT